MTPRAMEALRKEYERLEKNTVRLVETVRECKDVEAEALRTGKKIHIARLLELSSAKHEELPPELQKYKGRVVVQGDNMKDETSLAAVFADASSSASHIEASKLCDAVALQPGCSGEQSDAPGAYTQAVLLWRRPDRSRHDLGSYPKVATASFLGQVRGSRLHPSIGALRAPARRSFLGAQVTYCFGVRQVRAHTGMVKCLAAR